MREHFRETCRATMSRSKLRFFVARTVPPLRLQIFMLQILQATSSSCNLKICCVCAC